MADKDTKDERKDDKKPDHPQPESEVKAAAKKKGAKPEGEGEYDGEVKEGHQWSKRDRAWIEWKGTDYSGDDKSELPFNHEHVGDGSPQNPHRVQQKQRW